MRPRFATPFVLLALLVSGCGNTDTSTNSGSETVTGADGTQAPRSSLPTASAAQALNRPRPRAVPKGPTSPDLIVRDLVEGSGEVAQTGDVLLVRFLAGVYESGKEIEFAGQDEPIGFRLGAGDWSVGWESGMRGMHVGGRRELIFPTTPAFVPPGAKLGDTLVYVVDLLGITEAQA